MARKGDEVKFSYRDLSLQASELVTAFLGVLLCVACLAYFGASVTAFITVTVVYTVSAAVFVFLTRRSPVSRSK